MKAELLGNAGALGNYPKTLVPERSNLGNIDATNALCPRRGLQSGAEVDVTGSGVGGFSLEDGGPTESAWSSTGSRPDGRRSR